MGGLIMQYYLKEVNNNESMEFEVIYRRFTVLKDFGEINNNLKKGEVLEARPIDDDFYLIKDWCISKNDLQKLVEMDVIKWLDKLNVKDNYLTENDIGNWYISRNGNKLQLISLIQDKYFIVTDHEKDKYACDKSGFSVDFQGEKALNHHDLIFQIGEYEKLEFTCKAYFIDINGNKICDDELVTTDLSEVMDRYQPENEDETNYNQVFSFDKDDVGFFLDGVITNNILTKKLFIGNSYIGEAKLVINYKII